MKGRIVFLVLVTTTLWGFVFYYCEWLVFYMVLGQCIWPQLKIHKTDVHLEKSTSIPVYALVFADTHLLSRNVSTWFDKLRTNWEMHLAFQTALALHKPDVIFGLGDFFDEGLFLTNTEFDNYVQYFWKSFSAPSNMDMYLIAGNHDIGFHYEVTENRNGRFLKGFRAADVGLLTVQGNYFVLVNSVLLEGNETCSLCIEAKRKLDSIARKLRCAEYGTDCVFHESKLNNFSRPILIQHYPMYRDSDKDCHEPDEAPPQRKYDKFNETIDCASKNVSDWLLKEVNPRLVFSGHTHDGCTTHLSPGNGIEFTIPSLNWKHKHNPSYGLVVVTPQDYAFTRCLLPTQQSGIFRYLVWCIVLFSALLYVLRNHRNRRKILLFTV